MRDGVLDEGRSFAFRLFGCFGMNAVPIGGFDDQDVTRRRRLRISQDRHLAAAQISREQHDFRRTGLLHAQRDGGRSKNMPSVMEDGLHTTERGRNLLIAHGCKLTHDGLSVVSGVERPAAAAIRAPFLAIDIETIAFLNMRRIGQHHVGEIRGGPCREHLSEKALLGQNGQGARMIDMGMRKEDGVDGLRLEAEVAVSTLGLIPPPLKESAVEQHTASFGFNEVPAAGHGSCGAVE